MHGVWDVDMLAAKHGGVTGTRSRLTGSEKGQKMSAMFHAYMQRETVYERRA